MSTRRSAERSHDGQSLCLFCELREVFRELHAGNRGADDAGVALHIAFRFWIERVHVAHCPGHVEVDHVLGLATRA